MNIKFTDKEFFEDLKAATLAKVLVGSHLYGLNNEHSDRDYLYIYATSFQETKSVFKTHHQFQYVDDEGNDHLFINLHSFIANIVNGDAVLNFEALHSDEMRDSILYPLWAIRHKFYSLKIIRSYLGRAKKDWKTYEKLKDTKPLVAKKKLLHLVRGLHFAKDVREGALVLTGGVNRGIWQKVITANRASQDMYALNFSHDVDYVRDAISFNLQYRPEFMVASDQAIVDETVGRIMVEEEYVRCCEVFNEFRLDLVYATNETGVKYDA